MRIISGYSKGKKIYRPNDLQTRPLKDQTKESIFNIIIHSNKFNIKLNNSYVMDLFSGTGSFGLECLSRGSDHVTFVENYKKILGILRKNIDNLDYRDKSEIIEQDVIKKLNFKIFKKKFDIIFLDPPYKEKQTLDVIEKIIASKILKIGGIIIIHRHKKENDDFSTKFKIIEEKYYGISKIIFGCSY